MKNLLKKLFCKHTYGEVQKKYIPYSDSYEGCVLYYFKTCSKCGRKKEI